MSYILHIETTSTVCSIALSKNEQLIDIKEINTGYTHSENLHMFIHELLSETKIDTKQLQAISVSTGPGSYTGLRIGYASAKGLAYALNIPLITVNTLQALTASALLLTKHANGLYCPMVDARRMEVYAAMYSQSLVEVTPAKALILNEISITDFLKQESLYFFGNGMSKAKELLSTLPNVNFIENIQASALHLIPLAYNKYCQKQFDDVAYAEPLYLKDFYFAPATKLN